MADDNSSSGGGLLKNTQAWVAVAGTIATIWGVSISTQISQINSSIQHNTAERNWTAVVFDKYSDAVTRELRTEQRIAALNGLINLTDLIERKELQLKMAQVIRDQLDAYVKELQARSATQTGSEKAQTEALTVQATSSADAANIKVNQIVQAAGTGGTSNSTAALKTGWSNYGFDIFYCEGDPQAEASAVQSANAIASLKGLDPKATGRWRVRPLSVERNATRGFGISGTVIRPSSDDEVTLARQLQSIIKQRRTIDDASDSVVIKQIEYPTPSYISVFVCPAATVPAGGAPAQ